MNKWEEKRIKTECGLGGGGEIRTVAARIPVRNRSQFGLVLPWGRVGLIGDICLECSNNFIGNWTNWTNMNNRVMLLVMRCLTGSYSVRRRTVWHIVFYCFCCTGGLESSGSVKGQLWFVWNSLINYLVPLKGWEFLSQLWLSFSSVKWSWRTIGLPGDMSTWRWPSEGRGGGAGIHYTFHHSR
jgi:hypothetical protein